MNETVAEILRKTSRSFSRRYESVKKDWSVRLVRKRINGGNEVVFPFMVVSGKPACILCDASCDDMKKFAWLHTSGILSEDDLNNARVFSSNAKEQERKQKKIDSQKRKEEKENKKIKLMKK